MKKVAYNQGDFQFGLSEEAIKWLINHGKTEKWCDECVWRDELRSDPILIECIETLGYAANVIGWSDLAIKEIKGNRYTIVSDGEDAEQVLDFDDITWYE